MGSQRSPELREEEALRSAEILRVAVRRNAGLRDSGLVNDQESRETVAALIHELRPRVVVTHWRERRHPDHRVAAELAHDASFLAGLKNYPELGSPHRPEKVVYSVLFREDAPAPAFVVDISDHIDAKLAALACFESQFTGKTTAGEAFGGGDRPLLEQVKAQCSHHGSRIRTAYGEPFWTRETMELESLGRASVATF